MSPHEDHDPVMRGDGVAELEHGVEHGVARGVETDGVVGISHVVVDGAGDADDVDVRELMQVGHAMEGAVAADDDEVVDAALQEVLRSSLNDLGLFEIVRSARAEDGAAGVDAVGDGTIWHLDDVVLDHADIAVTHAVHFITLVEGVADSRPVLTSGDVPV